MRPAAADITLVHWAMMVDMERHHNPGNSEQAIVRESIPWRLSPGRTDRHSCCMI